jgi:Ca-activated chloride channel homolog
MMGIDFDQHSFNWVWIIVLFLIGLLYYSWRKIKHIYTKYFYANNKANIFSVFSLNHWKIKYGLQSLGLLFILLSIYNPRIGKETMSVKSTGADIYFAVDISNSMYTQDIAPSRLERAKRACENVVKQLVGNRIGIITFAGGAYLNMPISPDQATALNQLQAANPDQSANQGTAIGDAIELALKTFDETSTKNKVIVIVTDGETHDGNTMEFVNKAKEDGVTIIALGVGTKAGGEVRTPDGNFIYNEDNEVVVSKLNTDLLEDIAPKGLSYVIDNNDGSVVKNIVSNIQNLTGGELKTSSYDQKRSLFQIPLFIGISLMIASLFISVFKKSN